MGIARRARAAAVIGAAVIAGGLAACESSPALPILSDPHEIVTAAASSSAALGTVHVQIDLAGRNVDGGRQELIRYALQADIDVQGRNVAGRTQLRRSDVQAEGETSGFVVLNGSIFSREGADLRWSVNDDPSNGDHLPTNAAYLTMIETAISNGTAVLGIAEAVPCGAAMCYHVIATLAREASWSLLVAPLVGGDAGAVDLPRPEMVPAPASVDIYVDQATRSLTALSGTLSVQGAVITFSVTFSNHDLPIRIVAPPPELIGGGGGMEGGGGATPMPTPLSSRTP